MKVGFYLFKYFPFGGLQRDFLRIANECYQRGHEIHVFTGQWQGPQPPYFKIHMLRLTGWQNHTRSWNFAQQVQAFLPQQDVNIGFNKIPGLDIYYAADVCYAARISQQKSKFYRLLPRYRQWMQLEKAVFQAAVPTQILLIAEKEQAHFMQHYATPIERFHLLPPGINKNLMLDEHTSQLRAAVRKKEKLTIQDKLILMIGSGFKTKGVDRAIQALAALPQPLRQHTSLRIIGQDNPHPFLKLAKQLKVEQHVHFYGGREDIRDFLLAADLLLHPAYHENTGTVLLEAVVAGLPVLTVATCGYAQHIARAQSGQVLPEPFSQQMLNQALQTMLCKDDTKYRQNALSYARSADLFSMPEKAADLIELFGNNKRVPLSAP